MENDKLFEFMEKIYVELQSTKTEMREGFSAVNKRLNGLEENINSLEGKVDRNTVAIESIDKRLKEMAEVQETNYAENEKHHAEIVEMLTKRLDTQDAVIKNNITVVK